MHRARYRPVSQRRDDESLCAPQELVHVAEVDVSDADDALVLVLAEIEARLLEPLEVEHRLDVHLHLRQQQLSGSGQIPAWLKYHIIIHHIHVHVLHVSNLR